MLLRLIVAIFCLILLLFGGGAILSRKSGEILTHILAKEGIEFRAESSRLSFFPPKLEVERIIFKQGDRNTTAIEAKVQLLSAPIFPLALFTGGLRLGKVKVFRPQVEVIEGDGHSEKKEKAATKLRIDSIRIDDGEFTYRRLHKGRDATIHVNKISGDMDALVSPGDTVTTGRVTAQLEKSGGIDLSVKAAYFAPTPNVEVQLEIKGQNLADLNPYFLPADGVALEGKLILGRGEAELKGKDLAARVSARYRGLDLALKPHGERSGFEAFLGNLFRGLMVDAANTEEKGRDQKERVKLVRKEKESVVSALLRALREAMLQIATF